MICAALLLGMACGAYAHHTRLFHAPDSRDVTAAVYVDDDGACFTLEPVEVAC